MYSQRLSFREFIFISSLPSTAFHAYRYRYRSCKYNRSALCLLMVFAAYIALPTYICTPEPYQVYYDPNISLNIPVQVYPCESHKVSSTAISKDISGSILAYNMSLFTHHLCSNVGLSAEIPFKPQR